MSFFNKIFFSGERSEAVYYVAICCIIKDENDYLEEWMRYHRLIGVQHFYLYDNQSKIPVAKTLIDIGMTECATVNVINGRSKQIKAYTHCLKKFGTSSNWIAFIDTDEFILPKTSGGNLGAFLKEYEPFGGIGINWQIFGSNGHIHRTHKPQLESFTMRAKEEFHINNHIKCIVQPRYTTSVANSHSFNFVKGKFCVNENFEDVSGTFSQVSVRKIQLNHYYCRSLEEYKEKIARGLGDSRRERKLKEFYHHDAGANDVVDLEILELIMSKK